MLRWEPQGMRPGIPAAAALVSEATVSRFLALYLIIHRSLDLISGLFAKRAALFWAAGPGLGPVGFRGGLQSLRADPEDAFRARVV